MGSAGRVEFRGSAQEQYVGFNRVGMTDGGTHRLDFNAERHRAHVSFRNTNSLPPVSLELSTVSVMHV
jgi:hypothetical protein